MPHRGRSRARRGRAPRIAASSTAPFPDSAINVMNGTRKITITMMRLFSTPNLKTSGIMMLTDSKEARRKQESRIELSLSRSREHGGEREAKPHAYAHHNEGEQVFGADDLFPREREGEDKFIPLAAHVVIERNKAHHDADERTDPDGEACRESAVLRRRNRDDTNGDNKCIHFEKAPDPQEFLSQKSPHFVSPLIMSSMTSSRPALSSAISGYLRAAAFLSAVSAS